MEWLFALGIIGLATYNQKFRRVVFWASGVFAVLFMLLLAFMNAQPRM